MLNIYIIGIVCIVVVVVILAEIELFTIKSKTDIILPKVDNETLTEIKPKDSGLKHTIYVYDTNNISTDEVKNVIQQRHKNINVSEYIKEPVTEHIADTLNNTTRNLWRKITRSSHKTPINSLYNIVKDGGDAVTKLTPVNMPNNAKVRILHHKKDNIEGFIADGKIHIYKKGK